MRSGVLVGAAGIVSLCCSAFAADLPVKAPVMPPVLAFSWTGFYVGADFGGALASTDATTVELPAVRGTSADLQSFSLKGSSVIGGFHLGYNWQFAPSWVLGVEGDADWTRIDATASSLLTLSGAPAVGTSDTITRDVKWLATLRGRLGYAVGDWLFYGTGGAAWGGMDESATQSAFGIATWPFSASTTRSGWVAGAGIEHAFTRNWILRGEYLFYRLNGLTASATALPAGVTPFTFTDTFRHTDIQTFRVGISYKFF